MKLTKKYFILVISVFIINFSCNSKKLVLIKFHERIPDGLYLKRDFISNEEKYRLIDVLLFYGVDFNVRNDNIYIQKNSIVFKDIDLLITMCSKSNDSIWFKEHIKK